MQPALQRQGFLGRAAGARAAFLQHRARAGVDRSGRCGRGFPGRPRRGGGSRSRPGAGPAGSVTPVTTWPGRCASAAATAASASRRAGARARRPGRAASRRGGPAAGAAGAGMPSSGRNQPGKMMATPETGDHRQHHRHPDAEDAVQVEVQQQGRPAAEGDQRPAERAVARPPDPDAGRAEQQHQHAEPAHRLAPAPVPQQQRVVQVARRADEAGPGIALAEQAAGRRVEIGGRRAARAARRRHHPDRPDRIGRPDRADRAAGRLRQAQDGGVGQRRDRPGRWGGTAPGSAPRRSRAGRTGCCRSRR